MCYDDDDNDPIFPWEEPIQTGYGPNNIPGRFGEKLRGTLHGMVRGLYSPFVIKTWLDQDLDDEYAAEHSSVPNPEFYDFRGMAQVGVGSIEFIALGLAAMANYTGMIDIPPWEAVAGVLAVTNLVDLVRPRG
tara:strand:- start:238 stop:636 length:399 start_codon:yes stop_codon:yes gene_type:complete